MSSESDYTILVVDDDRASHIIVKNLIGKKYNLIHAQEPQQGINILSEKKIDLILSDIHMPGMTGLEFLEAIKKDAEKKNIPILLMTSLPTLEKEQKAMELGAKDFIQKDLFHEKPPDIGAARKKFLKKVAGSHDHFVIKIHASGGHKKLIDHFFKDAETLA